MLVASGADPHAASEYGFNAFHAAIDVNWKRRESVLRHAYVSEEPASTSSTGTRTARRRSLARSGRTGLEVRVLCELGADAGAVSQTRVPRWVLHRPAAPFHAANGVGVHKDVKTEARCGREPINADSGASSALARRGLLVRDARTEASYRAFFKGLAGCGWKARRPTQRQFVAEASSFLRTYVERFAGEISVSEQSEYAEEWRKEKISPSCRWPRGWARHESGASMTIGLPQACVGRSGRAASLRTHEQHTDTADIGDRIRGWEAVRESLSVSRPSCWTISDAVASWRVRTARCDRRWSRARTTRSFACSIARKKRG